MQNCRNSESHNVRPDAGAMPAASTMCGGETGSTDDRATRRGTDGTHDMGPKLTDAVNDNDAYVEARLAA